MIDWLNRLLAPRRRSPPATKSLASPCFTLDRLASPAWAPRDFAAFAREGFMQNAILYRAVRMIAEAAASVPLLLYRGDDEIADKANDVVRIPDLGEYLTAILATIPLQLLAYHVAVLKGTDVDQPRNLAKSVTVE